MYLVIDSNGSISKLDQLDGYIQEQILEGEIDVIDCETMKISNGYGFDPLPDFYCDPDI